MHLADKLVVVTGGGNGIGRALCRRFKAEGAKAIVVADVNAVTAKQVADEIGGTAITCDVSREADVVALVKQAIAQHGGRVGQVVEKPERVISQPLIGI